MWDDPIVAEVRRIREELSARFDFDAEAIFADIRSRQAQLGARLVRRDTRGSPGDTPDREWLAGQAPSPSSHSP